ncbi:MAG: RNA polymerase factor sigma-54 [Deltaproteobacteria bacterium]|nr:RNA polymerase factor sigma-54 [Deltaproteobacteria bacterium]
MALEIKQVQKLAQQLVMTPQLQQAIKLLQLSRVELEELISEELQENPALEEGLTEEAEEKEETKLEGQGELPETVAQPAVTREPSAADKIGTLDWQEYIDTHSNSIHGSLTAEASREEDDGPPSWENTLTKKISLEDHLVWQLRLSRLTEREETIGLYIIGNLDENGYLALCPEKVCQATGGASEEVESVLKRIQLFDPVGVAARDLRECLLVQLENIDLGSSLAARIVSDHLSQLESKRYEKLARELGVSVEEVAAAAHLIGSLEPKPAQGFEEEEVRALFPDVSVEKIDDQYVVFLFEEGIPRLRVSPLYRRLAGQEGEEEEQAREYLQEKVRAATWLIKSIHQRQQTLYRVTQSIFKFQSDFLDHGVSHLKPMVLRDVAEDIGMHESTVSRATANKYVHTPQGLFELKYFFQSGLKAGNGEDVASESVKEKIRSIISTEDPKKPYSDQHIAALLGQEAIDIARRTVAKYREAMRILPSSKRRQPYLRK